MIWRPPAYTSSSQKLDNLNKIKLDIFFLSLGPLSSFDLTRSESKSDRPRIYVCMYVCIYVYVYMYICMYIYIYMYV